MPKYKSKNEKETMKIASQLARKLKGGEVVALVGELGSGKTIFVKGLADGLGIKREIHSPTFILMRIYEVKKPGSQKVKKVKFFCHVDAYRLLGADELIDIGLLDWLNRGDTITVIEWADKVKKLLKNKKAIRVWLDFGKKKNERVIKIKKS